MALPLLINFLQSDNPAVPEIVVRLAATAMHNVADGSQFHQDVVIAAGALPREICLSPYQDEILGTGQGKTGRQALWSALHLVLSRTEMPSCQPF